MFAKKIHERILPVAAILMLIAFAMIYAGSRGVIEEKLARHLAAGIGALAIIGAMCLSDLCYAYLLRGLMYAKGSGVPDESALWDYFCSDPRIRRWRKVWLLLLALFSSAWIGTAVISVQYICGLIELEVMMWWIVGLVPFQWALSGATLWFSDRGSEEREAPLGRLAVTSSALAFASVLLLYDLFDRDIAMRLLWTLGTLGIALYFSRASRRRS